MRNRSWLRWTSSLAVAALLPWGAALQAQTTQEQEDVLIEAPPATPDAPQVKLGEYWIGVSCSPDALDKTLRAQLGIPDELGVAILSVVDESPASKAGLKENDILLKAGDKGLSKVQDLVDAVEVAKDQDLSIELIREGKKTTVTVKPEKRPEGQRAPEQDDLRNLPPNEAFWRFFQRGAPGAQRMWVPRQGYLLPPGSLPGTKLPKDMSVTITKEGEQPAKIVVKQGDKTWETTEEKLGDLPDDVRGHVQSFLGRSPFSIAIEGAQPNFGAAPFPNAVPGMRRRDEDARFKDIQKQLESLQQAIEALEKKLQAPR